MDARIKKVLDIWHTRFEDEQRQYSEFENSDIEYFVGCMLYNHFAFSKALDTMKTMDLSYDFLQACGEEYDEIKGMIESINLESELQKLEFLQEFIREAKLNYTKPELYLLERMEYHINALAQRYARDEEIDRVEFTKPIKSANPLLR